VSPSTLEAVGIVADELDRLAETVAGRVTQPGADLTSSPAVGIAPAFPWAGWRVIGRELTEYWIVRVIVGRWETGPSIDLALGTYRAATPPLRAAGYDVGPLDPPQLAQIGQIPHLLAAFQISFRTKD